MLRQGSEQSAHQSGQTYEAVILVPEDSSPVDVSDLRFEPVNHSEHELSERVQQVPSGGSMCVDDTESLDVQLESHISESL